MVRLSFTLTSTTGSRSYPLARRWSRAGLSLLAGNTSCPFRDLRASRPRRRLRADSVLHVTYVTGAVNPWRGISPIEGAATTRKLLDNLERASSSGSGRRGRLSDSGP